MLVDHRRKITSLSKKNQNKKKQKTIDLMYNCPTYLTVNDTHSDLLENKYLQKPESDLYACIAKELVLKVCLLVGSLTSQQHASVSHGPICTDKCTATLR